MGEHVDVLCAIMSFCSNHNIGLGRLGLWRLMFWTKASESREEESRVVRRETPRIYIPYMCEGTHRISAGGRTDCWSTRPRSNQIRSRSIAMRALKVTCVFQLVENHIATAAP